MEELVIALHDVPDGKIIQIIHHCFRKTEILSCSGPEKPSIVRTHSPRRSGRICAG